MKILLVNKFYYLRGGDGTALFNMEQLLKDKGHEVAVFSMQHPENAPSVWAKYFPKEINFSSSNISGAFSTVLRIFHSPEVARKFKRLIADFQPDAVHLHNIHSYLSPLVAQIAYQKGIRVVWTLHDYKLVCPNYICLRNHTVCEACFKNKFNVIRYKCMKDSMIASMFAFMEACWWHKRKLSRYTGRFISPSAFLKTKMVEAGFSPGQIAVLPNFIPRQLTSSTEKEDYYCYAGRLTEEKGVGDLLEAATQIPYKLKVIGGGPLLERFRNRYAGHPMIEFYGQTPQDKLFPMIQKARFLVVPSVWYENNPFSVIEALCMGTPVLGARIGGIPELIEEGKNGFLFRPGDIADLTNKINECFRYFTGTKKFQLISEDAQNKFDAETFYHKLIVNYEQYSNRYVYHPDVPLSHAMQDV